MTSAIPPRDWTDIHWPDIAGAEPARWIAVLPLAATEQHGPHLPVGTDVMIAQAYLARVRELLCRHHSGDVPSPSAGRDFHRAHRLSRHADAADRNRAEELDGARDERRARRRQEACHGYQPWRQQRGHDPCGAGSARNMRASRRHHGMVSLRCAGGIVFSGRIASRHPRRRGRDIDHAGAISAARAQRRDRRFSLPPVSRWKRIIAGFPRTGRHRSPGRPRTFIRAAPPAMPRRHPRRKASFCSIMARARSANCSPTSTNSIRKTLPTARRADDHSPNYL